MKFVLTQSLCREGMELLRNEASVYVANSPDPNTYPDEMRDADALIMRLASCDSRVIGSSPALKVIGRTGVGVDTVDVAAATARGIPVVVTPGANSRSVAEHTLALMFAISKNLIAAENGMRAGNWGVRDSGRAFELEGKTVGLIGLGAVGRETAKLCRAIGMRVTGYDPFLSAEAIAALGAEPYATTDMLLKDADIVSIHVPLLDSTRNMISARELAAMKNTAIVINCSRGGIVNEGDLIDALKGGVIAGAGLDVYCREPLDRNDPLTDCPNIVLSPHAASQTREAMAKMATMCAAGCLAVCRGEKWPYVADKTVYDHPRWADAPWAEA